MRGTATPRAVSILLLGSALVMAMVAHPHADDPVSTNVSFNREIARIIQRKCEPCHGSNGLAMSLSDYRDVRAWGRAVREELVEHRMPPAIVARGYGRYEADPSLNAREMATFLAWLDGGMPRGDDSDRPGPAPTEPTDAPAPNAGIRLALPPQSVPAGQEVVVRRVTIDAGAAAGRTIARAQFRPGSRRVLRGAMIFAESGHGSSWIGGWSPWQHVVVPPTQYAYRIPQPAAIVVDIYYRGSDAPISDQSSIDLIFAPQAETRPIEDVVVFARDAAGQRMHGSVKLAQPATVWALQPDLSSSVTSMELRAERPDKSVEVLLWIPAARAEWPVALVMQQPISLPAGTTLSLTVEARGPVAQASSPHITASVWR